jgi:hypothetical protein
MNHGKGKHEFMDKKRLRKKLDKICAVFLVLYFGFYILLSVMGKYDSHLDTSGKTKFVWGLSVPDVQIWQPKYLMLRSSNWNFEGLLYSPMILLDRLIWHKICPPEFCLSLKTIDAIRAVPLSCAALITKIYCERHR